MLDVAINFIAGTVSDHVNAGASGDNQVLINPTYLVDEAGKYQVKADSIGVYIANIEEERVVKEHLPEVSTVNGRHVVRPPELRLNLHILFAARFQNYPTALKHISSILAFFQANPSLTQDAFPALDRRIGRLNFDLMSLSYEQLNQAWAFIGGKHLPSLIYKVRMVAVRPDLPTAIRKPIVEVDANLRRDP